MTFSMERIKPRSALLPLVVMFLSFVGIVRADWLMAKWRHAIVVIAIIAAIVTPSNDPLTMTIFSIPLFFLYFLGVWLVRIMEKRRDRARAAEAVETESGVSVADNPLAYYESLAEPGASSTPSGRPSKSCNSTLRIWEWETSTRTGGWRTHSERAWANCSQRPLRRWRS